jgi:hypothetical protein
MSRILHEDINEELQARIFMYADRLLNDIGLNRKDGEVLYSMAKLMANRLIDLKNVNTKNISESNIVDIKRGIKCKH